MVYLQAVNYIRYLRQLGYQDDVTRAQLLRVGWKLPDIEDAFEQADNQNQSTPNSPSAPSTMSSTPKPRPKSIFQKWSLWIILTIGSIPLVAFALGYYLSSRPPV